MSDDLIKRSVAIKAVSKVDDYGDGIGFEVRSHCLVELELVPSADRPQGEWKHLGGDEWLCSNCGYVVWTEGSWEHPLERGKDYCEHCGAKMKGGDPE